ncbi:MAG: transcriptional repressor [Lachnospiraceae bacterium]|nr:transcriptional repressor [Lachnospiraceae bacterium]MDD3616170.1 transcriptional repressor [Lachnospiraceae bacterium]
MRTLKHSRQREAIKEFLMTRTDHPTADIVYDNLRNEFPNISLGTVYRNLALLSEIGEIQKLTTGTGADRFDGNINPHYHFICKECHCVQDLKMDTMDALTEEASKHFDGKLDGHLAYFYGTCGDCIKKS